MRKFALFSLVGLASCMTLTGCGHNHNFSSEWSKDENFHWHACECGEKNDIAGHTFDDSGYCSICNYFSEGRKFTEEKLGYLSGEFYAHDCVLNVSKDGAYLVNGSEVTSLANEKIEGSKYSTKVSYVGSDDNKYELYWKEAPWDIYKYGYMLPTLKVVGNENEVQFQPSIASIQGWYDGWDGELESSVVVYILQNDFDPEANMFQMYVNLTSAQLIGKAYHAASSFVDVGGETHIGISWFDNNDLEVGYNYEDWNYFVNVNKRNNRVYLSWFGKIPEPAYWARPSMFIPSYWKDEYSDLGLYAFYEDGLYFSNLDEDTSTVCIEGGEPVLYETNLDEYGVYYKIEDMIIRGTGTGMTITTAEGTVDYIPFYTKELYDIQYTEFSNDDDCIKYDTDWDTFEDNMFVNHEPADSACIVRYGDKLAYEAVLGDDTYTVIPFYESDAVRVIKNDENSIWFSEYLVWKFYGDYVTADGKSFVIDDDLIIYINDEEVGQGHYSYNAEWDVISVCCEGHEFFSADSDVGLYFDLTPEGVDIILTSDKAESVFGVWSNGKATLSIDKEKVSYNGKEYSFDGYDLYLTSSGFLPVAVFSDSTEMFIVNFNDLGVQLYNSNLEFISSFIKDGVLPSIVGSYVYAGTFGPERIVYTSDGKLYVDVLKDDKSGIETREFDYNPFISFDESSWTQSIVLEFIFKDVPVDIYFDGNGHASIFDINYMSEPYAGIQGLFGTTSDNIVSVIDTKIKYNGSEFNVENIDGNKFTGSVESDACTMTFEDDKVTIEINDNDPIVLQKNATQLKDFITDVHTNVSNLSRDIKVTEEGIFIRITGDENFEKVTDFEYVIDEFGNVSIKFVNSVVYTFTITLESGVVVITGESSLPPIPPPPPLF